MVRIQHSKKADPEKKVQVFDQNEKRTYFHDENGVPDYMDSKEFNKEFNQDE